MSKIVVIGGGACGLGAAMLLAKDGHEVTVLERDPAPPPSAEPSRAWDSWERKGVNQFRMIHLFACRWRQIVEANIPEVIDALDAGGALRFNPIALAPESMTGGWREGDERYGFITGRRPMVEAAVASVAATMPGVTVRRGTAVAGLGVDGEIDGVPKVVGVRTEDGDDLDAELVVDASGRRSSLPRLLADVGAAAPVESVEDSGFVYYARHFRSLDGSVPPMIGGILQAYESVSLLTLPADNGTWGVGLIASGKDKELRRLSDLDTWTRTVQSYPLIAHWLDGEPLEEKPAVMAKLEDRHRSFVVDGKPVAAGLVAVADAWACTNPSLGRGVSIGMIHVEALRDQVRKMGLDDPYAFSLEFASTTERTVQPYYDATLAFDRHRLAEIEAQIDGRPYETDDPFWTATKAFERASGQDGELMRAFMRIATVQETADEVVAQPGILDKLIELDGDGGAAEAAPGPNREELVSIVRGS